MLELFGQFHKLEIFQDLYETWTLDDFNEYRQEYFKPYEETDCYRVEVCQRDHAFTLDVTDRKKVGVLVLRAEDLKKMVETLGGTCAFPDFEDPEAEMTFFDPRLGVGPPPGEET